MLLARIAEILGRSSVASEVGCERLREALNIQSRPAIGPVTLNLQVLEDQLGALSKERVAAVAQELAQVSAIARAVPVFPRIYLIFETDFVLDLLDAELYPPHFGIRPPGERRMVNVSFCSPNANKPLHLGHARNMFIGMALSRLATRMGFEVVRSCTLSDIGTHVAKAFVVFCTLEKQGLTPPGRPDEIAGYCYGQYDKMPNHYSDPGAIVDAWMRGAEDQAFRRWVESIIACFQETFVRFGINFDHIFRESQNMAFIHSVLRRFRERGLLFEESDKSQYVLPLGDEGKRIYLLRHDGKPLYVLQRLANALGRFGHFGDGLARVLSVVASEQDEILHTVSVMLDQIDDVYGHRIEHVSYGMVFCQGRRIRSRDVNTATLEQTVQELVTILGKRRPPIKLAASNDLQGYAHAHLMHFLLSFSRTKPINFDIQKACDVGQRSFNAIAQIYYMLHTAETRKEPWFDLVNCQSALFKLFQYPSAVERSFQQRDPSVVVRYGSELAQEFFSAKKKPLCRIGDKPCLRLAALAARVLEDGARLCNLDLAHARPLAC
jgi:arginyl-tRNA synthetase